MSKKVVNVNSYIILVIKLHNMGRVTVPVS